MTDKKAFTIATVGCFLIMLIPMAVADTIIDTGARRDTLVPTDLSNMAVADSGTIR